MNSAPTQQQAIDELRRDLREARDDVMRARTERDAARAEQSRVAAMAGHAYSRGRMIAKLLAACEAVVTAPGESHSLQDAIDLCRAAIAEARGEP